MQTFKLIRLTVSEKCVGQKSANFGVVGGGAKPLGHQLKNETRGAQLPIKVYYHANFQVDPTYGL